VVTKLTLAAKRAGREALIAEYYKEFDKGDHGSEDVTAIRSEQLEEAAALAKTLSLASNLEELVGGRKMLPHMFITFFPENSQRKLVLERSIDAYMNAACKVLGAAVPVIGREVGGG